MRTGIFAVSTGMMMLARVAHSLAFDDAAFCVALQQIGKDGVENSRVAVAVACDAKIINFKIRPEVPVNKLPSGWQERAHALINQTYCQDPMRTAINNGWTVAFTIMSARESYYITADCRP
jgi:hypothetical protein